MNIFHSSRPLIILLTVVFSNIAFADDRGNPSTPIISNEDTGFKPVELSKFEGDVTLIDFWASWCTPCIAAMPKLEALEDEFKDQGFHLISINLDEDPDAAKAMIKKHGWDLNVFSDTDAELSERFSVSGLPSGFLLDARGKTRLAMQGYRKQEDILTRATIEKLLAERRVLSKITKKDKQ